MLALGLAGGCAAAVAATQDPRIGGGLLGVRFGGDSHETRMVFDLDRTVTAQIAEPEQPGTLTLTLSGVGAAEPTARGEGQGLIKGWSVVNQAGGAKVSVDLAAAAQVRRRFLLPPADGVNHYRYVVDLAAVEPPPAPAFVQPAISHLPPRLKKIIVVDAGHGGHDPGAQNGGTDEKDINLAAAKALKARLEKTGRYQVVLTRETDVYVPLDARVQIARRVGADLFISLHADSAGDNTEAHGASVYTLSEAGGGRVSRVLQQDEWFQKTAVRDDPAVGDILLDLTQRSTRNRSAVFAQLLLERINDQVELLPRSHRDAGFFVLLAPDVPAALLEMGFITSPTDEARLKDTAERGRLMDAVASAIDAYFTRARRFAQG